MVLVGWTATEMAALTRSTITPALEISAAVFYAPIALGAVIAAPVMLVRAVLDVRPGPQG
jgi:TRAP-type C4-dicarboxylate transport system permease small subunit